MTMRSAMPYPLHRMFEYLDIDIERSLKLMPNEIRVATDRCRRCDKFQACDFDVEVRYFRCPNRELLDLLEERLA